MHNGITDNNYVTCVHWYDNVHVDWHQGGNTKAVQYLTIDMEFRIPCR